MEAAVEDSRVLTDVLDDLRATPLHRISSQLASTIVHRIVPDESNVAVIEVTAFNSAL